MIFNLTLIAIGYFLGWAVTKIQGIEAHNEYLREHLKDLEQ